MWCHARGIPVPPYYCILGKIPTYVRLCVHSIYWDFPWWVMCIYKPARTLVLKVTVNFTLNKIQFCDISPLGKRKFFGSGEFSSGNKYASTILTIYKINLGYNIKKLSFSFPSPDSFGVNKFTGTCTCIHNLGFTGFLRNFKNLARNQNFMGFKTSRNEFWKFYRWLRIYTCTVTNIQVHAGIIWLFEILLDTELLYFFHGCKI